MPYERGTKAGISEGTGRKFRDGADLQRLHRQVSGYVMERNVEWVSPVYYYVDLNAGPGRYVDGEKGSPFLFLDNMADAGGLWKAWFCENDGPTFALLRHHLTAVDEASVARIRLFPMDHQIAVAKIVSDINRCRAGRKATGLVYADPNGTLANEEMETARQIIAAHPKMDVLMHLSANTFKRCHSVFGYPSLAERLASIGKRRLLIREPHTDYQWTFVLLTDWDRYPEWKSRGFHDHQTPQGAAIFERLVFPKRELTGRGQGQLW